MIRQYFSRFKVTDHICLSMGNIQMLKRYISDWWNIYNWCMCMYFSNLRKSLHLNKLLQASKFSIHSELISGFEHASGHLLFLLLPTIISPAITSHRSSQTRDLKLRRCFRLVLCRVGSVGSVSASRTVGREFASWSGHTKDHHKNGTNCLPAWHAMR